MKPIERFSNGLPAQWIRPAAQLCRRCDEPGAPVTFAARHSCRTCLHVRQPGSTRRARRLS